MQYKCKRFSAIKLIINHKGLCKSICESCKSNDCTNPIEKRKMSFFGVIKDVKAYCSGNDVDFVINCEGYIGNESI